MVSVKIVGSSPSRVKPKTIKLIFVASPLSMQQLGERTKTGWVGIRICVPVERHVYPRTVVSVSYSTIKIQLSVLV